MSARWDESKVVTPFMPSLLHCTLVKIGIPLFVEFGVEALEEAYAAIQIRDFTPSEGRSGRAKARLLQIPAHLQLGVMGAVHGLHLAVSGWKMQHYNFREEIPNLHWRPDGSIDAVRTARDLVRNKKFDIRDRFELACVYFFEDSVRALGAELAPNGEPADCFWSNPEPLVRFWMHWLDGGARGSWTQSLVTWMRGMPRNFLAPSTLVLRCGTFLPLLGPEERRLSFDLLGVTYFDDLRFCHYALTKDEEDQLLRTDKGAFRLLRLHLEWPLQPLFLDTARKVWKYMDVDEFRALLSQIFFLHDYCEDYNYASLFEEVWAASSVDWKEGAKEEPGLRERIDSYFHKKFKKRKCVDDGQME